MIYEKARGVGPKARPSFKNYKPEPGPGLIVKVKGWARPARGKNIEAWAQPEPDKIQARHITKFWFIDLVFKELAIP